MAGIANRIAKLEAKHGSDMDRWLQALTDEQLDARLNGLNQKIRGELMGMGVDCSDLSDERVCELAAHHTGEAA